MKECTEKIIQYLECSCEVIPEGKHYKEIEEWYYEHLEKGKANQYYPLIIVPSETLYEMMCMNVDEQYENPTPEMIYSYREGVLKEANQIKAKEFFANILQEETEADEEYGAYLKRLFEFEVEKGVMGNFGFSSFVTANGDTCEVILACIPVSKPWELAAWVPMGGWNDCPLPEVQTAVFQYWNEKFGVIPAVVSGDTWELTASIMPTEKEAKELAIEQFLWCTDRVEQWDCNIEELAGELMDSEVWYFWWD